MKKKKELLIIFARNPHLGKVKKRLAADIGAQAALDVYKSLLRHTQEMTIHLDCDKKLFLSEDMTAGNFFKSSSFRKELQQGDDLGQRMEHAFSTGFRAGYSKVVIIGSDLFGLKQEDVERAFVELEHYDYVLGPAKDGGYYLLGTTEFKPELFRNKSWGTDTVLRDTLKDLKQEAVLLLEEKNDIDRYEDLREIPDFQEYLKLH